METEEFNQAEKAIRDLLHMMDDEQKQQIAYVVQSQMSWDIKTHNILYTEHKLKNIVREELNEEPSEELLGTIIRSARWKGLTSVALSAIEEHIRSIVRPLKP